jgi:hypothetical protein
MKKLRKKISEKPHYVLSVPISLCCISFVTSFIEAIKDLNIDTKELHELILNSNGLETVILLIIMVILKDKKGS